MPRSLTAPRSTAPSPAPGRVRRVLPGLAVSVVVAVAAYALSLAVPAASTALVAILLGALAANIGVLPGVLRPGLDVAAKPVLRIGIVLLGLQLALGDILALGPGVIVLIVAVVAGGTAAGILLGRALRIPRTQALLIACGFSICGAAAVAAAAGALTPDREDGEDEEVATERFETQVATAVALVVVFGTVLIPLMPVLTGAFGLGDRAAGMWIGASVHEVAQVVAAGSLVGEDALRVAVLVKLGRVLLLAPMIALLVAAERRGRRRTDPAAAHGADDAGARRSGPPLVPLFVIGFLVAVAVRSTGLIPTAVLDVAKPVQTLCLAAAMFALGTGVRIALLRQVGGRPVVLAAAVTVVVGLLGGAGALLTS